VYGKEYDNLPINDRFELMSIAETVFNGGKVTWNREFYEEIRDYEKGEVLSSKFVLNYTNPANIKHKVKFSVYNYPKLTKIEFERIAKSIASFLAGVNTPLEVEVEVKVGGLVGAMNRGIIIRVNNASGGVKKIFTLGEFIKFRPYNPYPKYITIFMRNPKAFGLTKVTPDKVRLIGMNPSAIFNSDNVPVNLELYREAMEKLTNQKMFNFSYNLFKMLMKSLKEDKGLFVFMYPEDIARAMCSQSLAGTKCENNELMFNKCVKDVLNYFSGVLNKVIEMAGDREYWKTFGQYFYPVCVGNEKETKVDVLYRPEIE